MNERKLINKKVVLSALWFAPLTVPMTGIFLGLTELRAYESYFDFVAMFTLAGLSFGSFVWIPAVIIYYIIERAMYNPDSTKKTVIQSYLIQGAVTTTFIGLLLSGWFDTIAFIPVAAGVGCTQLLRWWYLNAGDRMHKGATAVFKDDVLDDQEIDFEIE